LYWEIAEYISVGASALGTIAAALSHQAVYAATPLTLALSLNLVNRQQLQKQIALSRQQTEAIAQSIPPSPEPSIAKIRKILQNHKRYFSRELKNHPTNEEIQQVTASLNRLKQQINSLIPPEFSFTETIKEINQIGGT